MTAHHCPSIPCRLCDPDAFRPRVFIADENTHFYFPPTADGYEDLRRVFALAVEQAASGKGKERHASEGVSFEDQPSMTIARLLGSNHYHLGQAAKKLFESVRLSPEHAKRELLGMIVYGAMAYLSLEGGAKDEGAK